MNNKIIDICSNKYGHLILNVYNSKTGKIETLKKDKDIKKYLTKVGRYPILEVKDEIKNNIDYGIIRYPKFILQMHDLDFENKNILLLKPLFESVQRHEEKEKLEKLNSKPNSKKKVQRINKYTNKKIAVTAITLGILIGAVTTISAVNSKNNAQNITYNNEIVTEALEYEAGNQEISFELPENDQSEYIDEDEKGFSSNSVVLDYEDLSSTNKALSAKENYGDIIEKYSNRYGLDAKLMLGIATQERGVHSTVMDKGGATGLMQIQNSVWLGNEISAYNFETGKYDKFTVTNDMLANLETNIQLGCMIFQNCLNYVQYNIPLAVQTYNYGIGNMRKVIDTYANITGQTRQDVISNQNDLGWLEYRDIIKVGDENYLNHVFSWMGEQNSISVVKKDNTIVDLTITNSIEMNKAY